MRAALLAFGLAAAGLTGSTARAQDTWTYTVTPYVWGAGIAGDIGADGRTAHIDETFSDVLSNLSFAFMGVVEARKDRFGLFADLVYSSLSGKQDTPHGVLADNIRLDTKSTMWTVGLEYRVSEQPKGSVDLLGGLRGYVTDNQLNFNGGLLDGRSASQRESWVDPVIGVKGSYDLSPKFYLAGWALIGGGFNSDFIWDLTGALGYRFTDRFSGLLGYRGMGVDYSSGGFKYDVVQQGMIGGVSFNF